MTKTGSCCSLVNTGGCDVNAAVRKRAKKGPKDCFLLLIGFGKS